MDVEVRLLQSYSNFGLFYPGRVNKTIKQSCAQAVSQLSRRARGQQPAQNQTQVERADINQLPPQDIVSGPRR